MLRLGIESLFTEPRINVTLCEAAVRENGLVSCWGISERPLRCMDPPVSSGFQSGCKKAAVGLIEWFFTQSRWRLVRVQHLLPLSSGHEVSSFSEQCSTSEWNGRQTSTMLGYRVEPPSLYHFIYSGVRPSTPFRLQSKMLWWTLSNAKNGFKKNNKMYDSCELNETFSVSFIPKHNFHADFIGFLRQTCHSLYGVCRRFCSGSVPINVERKS